MSLDDEADAFRQRMAHIHREARAVGKWAAQVVAIFAAAARKKERAR